MFMMWDLHCTGCHGLGSNVKSGENGSLVAEPVPRAQAIDTQTILFGFRLACRLPIPLVRSRLHSSDG